VIRDTPRDVLDVLDVFGTMRLPDELFLVNCRDDETIGACLVRGRPVIRDFAFADRWQSVFVRWNNMPAVATMTTTALKVLIDLLVPHYTADSWRNHKNIRAMYEGAFNMARRLENGGANAFALV
jgi:hypothetical protein